MLRDPLSLLRLESVVDREATTMEAPCSQAKPLRQWHLPAPLSTATLLRAFWLCAMCKREDPLPDTARPHQAPKHPDRLSPLRSSPCLCHADVPQAPVQHHWIIESLLQLWRKPLICDITPASIEHSSNSKLFAEALANLQMPHTVIVLIPVIYWWYTGDILVTCGLMTYWWYPGDILVQVISWWYTCDILVIDQIYTGFQII